MGNSDPYIDDADKYPILSRLGHARVLAVLPREDKFMMCEMCDENFGENLSRDELRQFAAELIAIAEQQ